MNTRILAQFLTLFFLFIISTGKINAYVPGETRNVCGIHLNQPEEEQVKMASALCNSNGGDWGSVTITIQHDDRNKEKWQQFMNYTRKYHLCPIVRIATKSCGDGNWCRPDDKDPQEWADFLGSLNWPCKERYVQIFNEVNDAREWGGAVDPADYARQAKLHIDALKEAHADFEPMLAAMNTTAGSSRDMDAAVFFEQMLAAEPNIFDKISCISSHSYGSNGPNGTGRASVRAYQWELAILRRLGVAKDLCVLITETGRPHAEGIVHKPQYHSIDTLTSFYEAYLDIPQNDPIVHSTHPFLLKDCDQFNNFSWVDCSTNQLYPFAEVLKNKPKDKTDPKQRHLINIKGELPKEPTAESLFVVPLILKNEGQAWLDTTDGYRLGVVEGDINASFTPIRDIQPGNQKTLLFRFKTGSTLGEQCARIGMYKQDALVVELFKWCYSVLPQPSLTFQLGTFIKTSGTVEIQVFDKREQVVYKQGVEVDQVGQIARLPNVVIGDTYRVVVVKDFHLPVQTYLTVQNGENKLLFNTMAPIDLNNDGKLDFADLVSKLRGKSQ